MREGRLTSPFGTEFNGVEITVGGIADSPSQQRTYEDIEKIFKANPSSYHILDEKHPDGTFKRFVVSSN